MAIIEKGNKPHRYAILNEKALREEVKKLGRKANQRLKRLENNKLTDSPAYQAALTNGEPRFSVRGKTHNQVQAEYARLLNFLNAETSTIRGINRNLKQIAENTGIKYRTLGELKQKTAAFFELSSRVEQYLRTVEDMASAIGYQKIWEAVNQYVKEAGIDLTESNMDVEQLTETISNVIKETGGNMKTGNYSYLNSNEIFFHGKNIK